MTFTPSTIAAVAAAAQLNAAVGTGYGDPTSFTLEELREDVRGLKKVAWSRSLGPNEQAHLALCEQELTERTQLVISGAEARDLVAFTVTYVSLSSSWSEVRIMSECAHGCKLYVRENAEGELVFQLTHSTLYGCALGVDHDTRSVPVKVDVVGL